MPVLAGRQRWRFGPNSIEEWRCEDLNLLACWRMKIKHRHIRWRQRFHFENTLRTEDMKSPVKDGKKMITASCAGSLIFHRGLSYLGHHVSFPHLRIHFLLFFLFFLESKFILHLEHQLCWHLILGSLWHGRPQFLTLWSAKKRDLCTLAPIVSLSLPFIGWLKNGITCIES